MAIRIPILTSFDPKGLKQANASFANLQGSVRSLGSNFAALGVALAGAGALIAKNVQSLARIESINAQTAQTISSMGNAANISAKEVEALAGQLESLTATEAESIQEGANLLLTFGNISNQLGEGNDIFTQTTEIMVDFARVMRKGPADAAIQLGKALNDPTIGMTALRKAGVSFTEQQTEQVKALQSSGDLLGAQKVILAELQKQFGGSGAAYAKTFSGQLELMGHELGTIGEEATMAVMPALQGMIEQLRLLIPEIGPKLKAAIESVDWKGLITSVVDFTRFLIENAEIIAKSVAALWALSTIVKTVNVLFTLGKVAADLYAWGMANLTTKTALATVATNLLSAAMRLIPFVAVVGGLFLLVEYFNRTEESIKRTLPGLGEFETKSLAAADTASRLSPVANAWRLLGIEILNATGFLDKFNEAQSGARVSTSAAYDRAEARRFKAQADASRAIFSRGASQFIIPDFGSMLGGGGGGAAATIPDSLQELIQAQKQAANAEAGILDKRVSAFESFANSVKQVFGQIKESIMSSFNLPTLGNSINSITRNIGKLLEKTKSFAQNISKLAGLGLNPALLQQVIGAGPMAGSQLAAALVGGGSAFVSQLNSAYGEFGNLASGIAGVGTGAAFANAQTVNNYSINVTGGVATSADIGRAIVNAISSYERQSGAAWRA
jgi:hypothetical protein